MSTSIRFLGAIHTVTGSRFLIESNDSRVLVDSGLFQGTREIKAKNWEPFPTDLSKLDALVLTHAHLDHCGAIPLIVKQGFTGPIFATEYSMKMAEVILRDSARIQTEDAKYAAKKGYSKHANPQPLYEEVDVDAAMKLFKVVEFHTEQEVAPGISATWYPSGHILGSAFVTINANGKNFLFTGDMGRPHHPVLVSPDARPNIKFDAIVTESTYGDRIHETPSSDFSDIIKETVARGGSVLIPAFAVDRTEVILMQIREQMEQGLIPRVPVYVDSPMALTSLDFYRAAIDTHETEIQPELATTWEGRDPFDPGTLHEMRSVEQSKSLNDVHTSSIIVSASGMASGGRVVHHLARMLPDPKNTVMLVGYQAAGTRGRLLESGADEVRIHGEMVPVEAQISKVGTFSVHADADELIEWLKPGEKPEKVFVVHGETGAAETFAERMHSQLGWNTIVPKNDEPFDV